MPNFEGMWARPGHEQWSPRQLVMIGVCRSQNVGDLSLFSQGWFNCVSEKHICYRQLTIDPDGSRWVAARFQVGHIHISRSRPRPCMWMCGPFNYQKLIVFLRNLFGAQNWSLDGGTTVQNIWLAKTPEWVHNIFKHTHSTHSHISTTFTLL